MITSTPDLADRLRGAVWGHLIGDAVGVPYEFGPARPAAEVRFGHRGAHGQPPGTWSDDGALMLALLDSLLDVGFDLEDQGQRALAWYRKGAYTPGRDGVFDIGTATRTALHALEAGTPAAVAGPTDERSGGNGSLMRILPVALVDRDAMDEVLIERAMGASRVTHGHARPQVSCALYVLIAARLLRGQGGRSAALADARAALRSHLVEIDDRVSIEALDHLEAYTDRGGHGRVWDAFWSAWDAFAGASDYRETIQRAVAYGNDTDTTAAIAGGLAGIHWGIDGIPKEWLTGMRGANIVDPMLDRLIATTRPATSHPNPIRVDKVPLTEVLGLADVPGRLGMTFLPGKRSIGRSGVHRRDLTKDAETLRELGVDALVLLVEDHELVVAKVPNVIDVLAAHGIETIRFPIVDVSVPRDRPAVVALLADIEHRLRAGSFVAVACMGGLGRTGTIVASLLVRSGLTADDAIALTRKTRHGAIETPGQERYVREAATR